MTEKEKARAYDEALEKAREYWETDNDNTLDIKAKGTMEHLFPELKESEDEKIKKRIIQAIKIREKEMNEEWSDEIAWLEKQGEHANFRNKIQIGDKVTRNRDGVLVNLSQLNRVAKKDEKQGEQNHSEQDLEMVANPKFHEGDWIVYNDNVYQIHNIGLKKYYECLRTNGTVHTFDFEYIDSKSHLWTIQDAKDGDVLATDSWLYIFKYTNNKAIIQFHCTCPINGKPYKWCFSSNDSYLDIYVDANIHPATKEQRDLLFQKMHKAGYNFDFEKKELKKIVLI